MKIRNIDGLSARDLHDAVSRGARFKYYVWTVSAIALTFKRTSDVYLVRAGDCHVSKGLGFTLLSFLFGWWGIPFGPRCTLQCIRINLQGGNDVTDEVMSVVAGYMYDEQRKKKK